MPLPIRFFVLKICQQNGRNGKFVSLLTAALHRELSPPHFRRFFASTTSASSDDGFVVEKVENGNAKNYGSIDGAWRCTNCAHLNWPQQRICKHCTVGVPTEAQMAILKQLLWMCPNCTARNTGDHCGNCALARCSVYKGFWVCSLCTWRNIPVNFTCRKCKKGKQTEEQRQLIQQQRWVCGECKHHNFKEECFSCGAPESKRLPDGVGGESLSDGSWYCVGCGFLNFPNYSKCRHCHREEPTDEQLGVIHSSRWQCAECHFDNYESNLTCHHCDAPRPTEGQLPATSDCQYWVCSSCLWRNFPTHLSCQKCIKGRAPEENRQQIQQLRWVCGICRHHNFKEDCFKCGAPKSKGFSCGIGGESLDDGSWYCVSCWFLNFPNVLTCRQCREGVPTDDQLFAIRNSRWECLDCGAYNYASIASCYKCSSPAPSLSVSPPS
ncbi:hypothetical protein niasHT_038945 [Heterodera trifolii]|uniref:RanBP2-type domain-containing protein n=1 Tax=Heterodera trifolii TaxID=157864 RepID=A0ABD2IBV6_9BILA